LTLARGHRSIVAMRGWPAIVALAVAPAAAAGENAPPGDATAFIRVSGQVRAESEQGLKQKIEKDDVELGTGSGFVISAAGYVLTSHHVISARELTVERHGERMKVSTEVKTIEVVLPAAGRRFEASIAADDPDLDLAVLSVPAADLPFIRLGDSDTLQPGDAVQALGFPLGRDVEVARAVTAETVPQVSVSRGTVAALRASDGGEARYIQTDATINPGSSGGPLLDEDGNAVGVVRMKLRPASGVGFAVPINLVKDFLEARGLDRVFPGRRLRLGPQQSFDWKGLRLRSSEGLQDVSPARLRVDTGPAPEEARLVVDRAFTPLTLADLEALLLAGAFKDPATRPRHSRAVRVGARPALVGSARGGGMQIEYEILDLGREKVLARYAAPEPQIAFNRSVLRDSLESLEADALLTAEIGAPIGTALERAALPRPDAPAVAMPRAWTQEPTPPPECRGLAAVDSALSASPTEDFTVTFRAGWRRNGPTPEDAAAACAGTAARPGTAAYALRSDRMGVAYERHGLFLRRDDGLLQLEMEAPSSKAAFLRDLFAAWAKQ
jgi:S1-C subfamily serine protease